MVGKSSQKTLSHEELNFLKDNIHEPKERMILIGTAYAGMRAGECVQCRFKWLEWKVLKTGDNTKRVLAVNIPIEDQNIVNKHLKLWRVKTYRKLLDKGQTKRITYILDNELATEFYMYYKLNPNGISHNWKSKNLKSIVRNISEYIIKVKWLKLLHKYHYDEKGLELEQIEKVRPTLSAHPLRATAETALMHWHEISLDVAASMLGHTEETAKKHYINNSPENMEHKLARNLMR